MADPVTIGMMAISAAGSLAEGIGANAEAKAEARALDANAIEVGTQGAADALYGLRTGRLQAGADLAASAAGGVGAGNGTLSDLMRANAEARWQQAFDTVDTASRQAAGLRAQAKGARRRGGFALAGGLVRAGANALSIYSADRNADRLGAANARRRKQEAKDPAPLGALPLPRTGG